MRGGARGRLRSRGARAARALAPRAPRARRRAARATARARTARGFPRRDEKRPGERRGGDDRLLRSRAAVLHRECLENEAEALSSRRGQGEEVEEAQKAHKTESDRFARGARARVQVAERGASSPRRGSSTSAR